MHHLVGKFVCGLSIYVSPYPELGFCIEGVFLLRMDWILLACGWHPYVWKHQLRNYFESNGVQRTPYSFINRSQAGVDRTGTNLIVEPVFVIYHSDDSQRYSVQFVIIS